MPKLVTATIVFVVLVAAASWGWLELGRELSGEPPPPSLVELENALALPGLLALASADLGAVLELTAQSQAASATPPQAAESWRASLAALGVDPRTDIEHLLAATYARDDGSFGVAFAAFGAFAPEQLESRLRSSPEFAVAAQELQGEAVLRVMRRDRTTCEESGPWLLHADAERLLIADPETLAAILAGGPTSEVADGKLAEFREFRASRIVSMAAFLPEQLSPSLGSPMASMVAGAALSKIAGFRSVYFGAKATALPPRIELASKFDGGDAALANETAAKWNSALEAVRAKWQGSVPTALALSDALAISVRESELWVEARLDRGMASQLPELPSELAGAIFGSMADGMSGTLGGALGELRSSAESEQLDPAPLRFAPSQPVETLAAYDPSQSFAGGEVETDSGPFGFRLLSASLPRDPEAGVELVIEALGTGLTNLGEQGKRAQLSIASVRGRAGEELLANELCGADRNDLPVAMQGQGVAGLVGASKAIRLISGALPEDIAFIEGEVKLRFPVRTEVVRLSAPAAGSSVSRAGADFSVAKLRGSSISWNLAGEQDRMLHLRALNGSDRALAQRSSMTTSFMASKGRSGTTEYAGEIAHLEAVFATEEEEWEFPFSLTNMTPGSRREQIGETPVEFVEFPIQRIRADFAQVTQDLLKEVEPSARSQATAGPFVVSLDSVWSFGGLMPRFEVHAPAIPNLEHSLTGVELLLRQIRLRDGTVHAAPEQGSDPRWSQWVRLADAWGAPGLHGDVAFETGALGDADEVAALLGAVVLRMPKMVTRLTLESVALGKQLDGARISLVVSKLARDRFVLRSAVGGERVLAVRAYNARDEMLWMSGAEAVRDGEGWEGEFQLQGVPKRIDVFIADELETAEYPFAMELAVAEPR